MDIQLSIAALDFSSGEPDLSALRDRYQEISFVFDHIDDLKAENEVSATERRAIEEDAARELNLIETRVHELRQALLSVAELALDLSEATSSDDKYEIVSVINEIVKEATQ